jgi:hypothetical protein
MTRRAYKLVRVIRGAGGATKNTFKRFWITKLQFYKIIHIDFGFEYFSHQQFDEPDQNLVFIFGFPSL